LTQVTTRWSIRGHGGLPPDAYRIRGALFDRGCLPPIRLPATDLSISRKAVLPDGTAGRASGPRSVPRGGQARSRPQNCRPQDVVGT
jgi:hypothetical protein